MAEIVLVHGAWHGPWCWDQVAGSLRERGHNVHAITLPGHDQPGTSTRIWHRISAYLAEVDRAVTACPEPPLLVGHSMGGYLTQRYLEDHEAAAGVLVASASHRGALPANLRILRRLPRTTLSSMARFDYHRLVSTRERVHELFFSPDTPAAVIDDTAARMQSESALAIMTMLVRPPRFRKVTTPIHVISAEGDTIFPVAEQRSLARAYGAVPTVLPGGHDLMLDTTWPQLADAIDRLALP